MFVIVIVWKYLNGSILNHSVMDLGETDLQHAKLKLRETKLNLQKNPSLVTAHPPLVGLAQARIEWIRLFELIEG